MPATHAVGVPAFNQGPFLRETLESLLAQEVPFDEIVVADNWSTDETPAVLAAVEREHPGRIRIVRPPAHLPAVANWNFTVGQLRGEWVSLLSSDDRALKNFSRSVRAAVALSPRATLVRGGWRNIDGAGKPLGEHHLNSVRRITAPARALREQREGPKASFAAFALRREVWERTGGFPENVALVGDWGMWLLAGALGDTVATGDLIAEYRQGHQPEVWRARLAPYVRELQTVYAEILPRATALGGFGRPAWIDRASRKHMRAALRRISREVPGDERADLVEAFRPWAEATGSEALIARFERGAVLPITDPVERLRPLARQLLGRLRGRR